MNADLLLFVGVLLRLLLLLLKLVA